MIYVLLPFVILWMFLCCLIGFGICIVRFRHPTCDRDFGRLFAWGTLKIIGTRVKIEGREHLESHQPCIYVANHQSGLDMATMGTIYPKNTSLIGKKELLWIPLFGLFYWAAGNIFIDRQKRTKAFAGLQTAVEAIKSRGVSIFIFPEGTRNREGHGLLPFKKGAFHMAIGAQVPVVPIVSSPLSVVFNWKRKRFNRGAVVTLKILPPIPTQGLTNKDVDALCEKTRSQMLAALGESGPVQVS